MIRNTHMDEITIIHQLEELAETFGFQIRYEPIKLDDELTSVPGGVCQFKGESLLIINSNATGRDKIKVLAQAVKHFDLDRVYIRPALRELLERER